MENDKETLDYRKGMQKFILVSDENGYLKFMFAEKQYENLTTQAWLTAIGLPADELISNNIRGYVDSTGIYAYIGTDFHASSKIHTDFIKNLGIFTEQYEKEFAELDKELVVYAGLIPTTVGQKYKPLYTEGTLSTYL